MMYLIVMSGTAMFYI